MDYVLADTGTFVKLIGIQHTKRDGLDHPLKRKIIIVYLKLYLICSNEDLVMPPKPNEEKRALAFYNIDFSLANQVKYPRGFPGLTLLLSPIVIKSFLVCLIFDAVDQPYHKEGTTSCRIW